MELSRVLYSRLISEANVKHKFKRTEGGDIDIFAYQSGEYHNGPECVRCGAGFCHHCHRERYDERCSPRAKRKEASNDSNLRGIRL